MIDIIPKLKTREECIQLIKNVRETNPELAKRAWLRAVELQAGFHKTNNEVELEILKALYAYEEVLYEKHKKHVRASRTWQSIDRNGIIGAAEKAVNGIIEPAGYKLLAQMGMQDLTFEAVIVRYPGTFSEEAVLKAKARLKELSGI